ncbi:PilN domain-containing protein [Modicisalibacter coralii]|uniref:PilN domain-containing protein n=1 Tax=Modicisalibacter coralii TaxID=2304602 RepID=UPI00100A369D|nr:PilN domain-containing protein [Halomonas coralii]
MTIEINLLPWREARRERRHRRFKQVVVLAALLGVGSAWGVASFYQQRLDTQQQRNRYVQTQTQQLDRDIATLRDFRTTREQMLTQIQLIRELQFSRPQTVRVFNQLTRSLQDGVYYTKLSREGDVLRLTGKAEANRQVSDQMRALAAMPVFGVPTLSAVEAGDDGQRRFDLTVREVNTSPPPDVGEGAKDKGATP